MSLYSKIQNYWALDGDESDSHGSNNGTGFSITYNTPGVLGTYHADFNSASPSYIDYATNVPVSGGLKFSIYFWVRTSNNAVDILGFGSEITDRGLIVGIDASGYLTAGLYLGATAISATAIDDGSWHLVGLEHDSAGGTFQIYIDNSASGSSVSVTPNIGGDYFTIGIGSSAGTYFTGDLSDVSFFNNTLTSGERSSLWNSGSGLIYPFIESLLAGSGSFNLTGNTTNLNRGYTLQVSSGSFNLTGNASTLTKSDPVLQGEVGIFELNQPPLDANLTPGTTNLLIADTAQFNLTGNDSILGKNITMPASVGSFSLTGNDATLTKSALILQADVGIFDFNEPPPEVFLTPGVTNLLIADRAEFNLTANGATIGRIWPVDTGAFNLTGNNINTPLGYSISCSSGAFALNGNDTALNSTKLLEASIGAFNLTGNDATLTKSERLLQADVGIFELNEPPIDANLTLGTTNLLIADRGQINLTGNDAVINKNFPFTVDNVSFSSTGYDVTFTKSDPVLQAESATFDLNQPPCDANLTPGSTNLLIADRAEFNLTGYNATIGRVMPAESGVFNLTGYPILNQRTYVLSCNTTSFSLTGNDTGVRYNRLISNTTGAFTFTGTNTGAYYGRVMPLVVGAFTFTGNLVSFNSQPILQANLGSFTLTGGTAQLIYGSVNGPGLVLLNLEEAFAKLMDKDNPDWPGFPPNNAVTTLNFANAIDAYAKFVRPQSAGSIPAKAAFIVAMAPLLEVPIPIPFFPALQAGMTAYATALGLGMTASGYTGIPPVVPADWTAFLALPKSGPLEDKITDLATVIHEWFLEGTAIPIPSGSTINWS